MFKILSLRSRRQTVPNKPHDLADSALHQPLMRTSLPTNLSCGELSRLEVIRRLIDDVSKERTEIPNTIAEKCFAPHPTAALAMT
jgi:hypothetical protein